MQRPVAVSIAGIDRGSEKLTDRAPLQPDVHPDLAAAFPDEPLMWFCPSGDGARPDYDAPEGLWLPEDVFVGSGLRLPVRPGPDWYVSGYALTMPELATLMMDLRALLAIPTEGNDVPILASRLLLQVCTDAIETSRSLWFEGP